MKTQHTENNYRNKITILSFVLSIFVVTIHAYNLDTYSITDGWLFWLEKYENTFAGIAVPMFYALSGYLFFQNYTPQKLFSKWKSRFFSVVIPYLLWNIIAYLYYEIIYNIPFVKNHLSQEVEPFSFWNLVNNALFGGHNVTWFMQRLIIFIIIAPLIYFIIKYKAGAVILFFTLYIFYVFTGNSYISDFALYIFGACFGIHLKKYVMCNFGNRITIIAGVYLALSMLMLTFFELKDYGAFMLPFRFTQLIALWICADVLVRVEEPKWWMKLSFFIYVSHSMILESIEKLLLLGLGQSYYAAIIDFFVAPLITLLIIIALAACLKRIKPLWFVLTGNRG